MLLVEASAPPIWSVLVTGCAAMLGLGWLLDRLGTNRWLWGALWAACAVTVFTWSITAFPSLDAAIAKNGSLPTYVASSSQLGITAASLLALVVAAARRVMAAARSG